MRPAQIEEVEVELLLEAVHRVWGHDFRQYARASLRRRLALWMSDSGYSTLSEAQGQVLRDPLAWDALQRGLTVNVTEMYRDPEVFALLRAEVLPVLQTYAFSKIWVAGCASGEEVYSMAILLHEAGLAERCRIYATDLNEEVLQRARAGVYSLEQMRRYTGAYQRAGGRASFSDYYSARYGHAIMAPELRRSVVFAAHNLATDSAFGEMQLVLCRNVMIYFNAALTERVLALFDGCLSRGGFLGLGQKESLAQRPIGRAYQALREDVVVYRKLYA